MKRKIPVFLLLLMMMTAVFGGCRKGNTLYIKVLADAELRAPMEEVTEQYLLKRKNVRLSVEYDRSESLFERIKDFGEECDVLLTDSPDDLDILSVKRLLVEGTRKPLFVKQEKDTQIVYLVSKVENRDTDIEQSESVNDFIEYLLSDEALELFGQYGLERYTE